MPTDATRAKELAGLIERVEALSIPEPMSGCWLWLGTAYEIDGRWKPYFYMQGRQWLAHRASLWLFTGPFPREAFICHRCDNPMCVNPAHLYVGDHTTNMRDMAVRKRSHFARHPETGKTIGHALGSSNTWTAGESNPKAKLTEEQVAAIRSSRAKTNLLAAEYNVHRTTIQRIRRGALWN